MAIEHSDALEQMQAWYKRLEPKLIKCEPVERPVYAHPLTAAQVDKVNKYKGYEYNVRLIQVALKYEDGKPVFLETDLPLLLRTDPAVLSVMANSIVDHVYSSFDQVKNS